MSKHLLLFDFPWGYREWFRINWFWLKSWIISENVRVLNCIPVPRICKVLYYFQIVLWAGKDTMLSESMWRAHHLSESTTARASSTWKHLKPVNVPVFKARNLWALQGDEIHSCIFPVVVRIESIGQMWQDVYMMCSRGVFSSCYSRKASHFLLLSGDASIKL